jgi:NADH dehydrogenase FAD-containing subunit
MLQKMPTNSIRITVVQPNAFVENSFGGPVAMSRPDLLGKFVTEEPMQGVTTVFGVAIAAEEGWLTVAPLGGGTSAEQVPFDFLVAATGFSLPTFLAAPGQTLAERRAELERLDAAMGSGGNVVVSGGGIVALEMAGNVCEKLNGRVSAGRLTLVTTGATLLPGYPARYQAQAQRQLERLGATVVLNDRVTSHDATATADLDEPMALRLQSGAVLDRVTAFVPAFTRGGATAFLRRSLPKAVDPASGLVLVNEYLQR